MMLFLGGTTLSLLLTFLSLIFLFFFIFSKFRHRFFHFFQFFPKQNDPANYTSQSFKISPKCQKNYCNPRQENRAKVWSHLKKQRECGTSKNYWKLKTSIKSGATYPLIFKPKFSHHFQTSGIACWSILFISRRSGCSVERKKNNLISLPSL